MTITTPGRQAWTGSFVAERLGVGLRTDSSPLGLALEDLVGLALRRNPRRAHLLVSRVLGKHVPTDPRVVEGAGLLLGRLVAGGDTPDDLRELGALLRGALDGDGASAAELLRRVRRRDAALSDASLVLGYAETATGLGECVARALGTAYLSSTRRQVEGVEAVGGFEEAHSHATSHLLLPEDPLLLAGDGPVVLVDDELTSGRTVLHTIEALQGLHARERYVVATLADLRAPADRSGLANAVAAIGARVDVVSLISGEALLPADLGERANAYVVPPPALPHPRHPGSIPVLELPWHDGWTEVPESGRHGILPGDWPATDAAVARCADALDGFVHDRARVLVVGTEELMGLPLRLASALAERHRDAEIRSTTTTRSPVVVLDEPGYAVRAALAFPSPEDGGPRWAYNIRPEDWDRILLVTEVPPAEPLLAQLGPDAVVARVTPRRPLPPPLHGPDFGSYAPDEVRWLLTDLSGVALEAPVEEREEAIQAGGAHYAESLPVEYTPSPAYLELFSAALEEGAAEVANAVGVVAELLLAERGPDAVLASLARAGTPVGVLVRRWARWRHGLDLPHHAVSIVRGRGIDETALRWLDRAYGADRVVFLDGWTGKGAIARELTAALDGVAAAGGPRFDDRLAVLADPGRCVETFGTREDFLIPSACLNSTVSGLVSRTVLNDRLLRRDQFHGAKHYRELAADDVTGAFVDAVAERFPDVAAAVDADLPGVAAGDRTPDWAGWAAVEEISERYGIGDPTLVKPGVGETTRVLLRRVPWRVLVRSGADAGLAHVLLLAEQRGVAVEEVDDMPYRCVGLIHPRYTRGATGGDGRTALVREPGESDGTLVM